MKVWLNGTLVDGDEAKVSVLDHGVLYGDGVFEGIRAYGGRVFQCQAHMDRLFNSAEAIRLTIPYTKEELTDAIYETMRQNGRQDAYIRLVVTRGAGTLGLNPYNCDQPNTFIITDSIQLYPEEMYTEGMAVIIAKTVRLSPRMVNTRAKTLNYLNSIYAKIEAIDAGVPEAVMLNEHGDVTECTGDNLFVVKDGSVFTPPIRAGLLPGITRDVVIELARKNDIPLEERDFKPEFLLSADECFLTGTAAEIIAVTTVDGQSIGDGKVGPITRQLMDAFHQLIRAEQSS